MNIEEIIACPECLSNLTDNLECNNCHHHFSYKYGVYDLVSQKLSSNQKILWRITDEDIEREDVKNNSEEKQEPEWIKDYISRISDETKDAQQKQFNYIKKIIDSLSGVVCDLATGMGGNLRRLLNSKKKNFKIVCTDIDRRVLAMTRKELHTNDSRVFYIASDGRYMSIKNDSFDYVTSVSAFGNIPESNKVAKELYRILKPKGKLIIEGTYIDKDSKSYELAKSLGLEKGMVEEFLTSELEKAGFSNINSTIVAKAIWAENPYDMLPVAGDMQYFCIIQAEK